MSTAAAEKKKNPMRKEQVLAEPPNKTIYTQPGTLTQILPNWELIKNVTLYKGDHKQFLSPLLCSGAISFSILLFISVHIHTPDCLRGGITQKNELLIRRHSLGSDCRLHRALTDHLRIIINATCRCGFVFAVVQYVHGSEMIKLSRFWACKVIPCCGFTTLK